MLCQECSEKPTCVELCEKAEKWVNQDHVSQREMTFPQVAEGERGKIRLNLILDLFNLRSNTPHSELVSYFTEEKVSFPFLPNLQNKCLHLFYFGGYSRAEIAKRLSGNRSKTKLNQNAVKHQLSKARKEIVSFFSKNTGGENV